MQLHASNGEDCTTDTDKNFNRKLKHSRKRKPSPEFLGSNAFMSICMVAFIINDHKSLKSILHRSIISCPPRIEKYFLHPKGATLNSSIRLAEKCLFQTPRIFNEYLAPVWRFIDSSKVYGRAVKFS